MYLINECFPTKKFVVIPVNGYGLPDHHGNLEQIYSLIKNNPDVDIIIFDKSHGPFDDDLQYLAWANSLNLTQDFVIVTANYKYHYQKHPNIVHVDRYFFELMDDLNTKKYNISDPRPYPLSCLSRHPWLHKSLNFLAMRRQPWFDCVKVSFGVNDPGCGYELLNPDLLSRISDQDAEYLRSIYPLKLDIEDDNMDFHPSNDCPTFRLCYADYAPESRAECFFLSEKSWKPVFSGQWFFVLGSPGIIKYLEDIGVDVFRDIIDHSYDSEADLEKRIAMIMTSITAFFEHNLDQLWIDTLPRRQKNLDLVYDPAFRKRLLQDLSNRVS